METTISTEQENQIDQEPERPQFLQVLCILSYVSVGLWLIIYLIMSFCLGIDEDKIGELWEPMVNSNPAFFEELDGVEFFRNIGLLGLMGIATTLLSLLGVIMMWRLNATGFYIYALTELASNFMGMGMNFGQNNKGPGGIIFGLVIDLVFIVMYFLNLKHMKKRNT